MHVKFGISSSSHTTAYPALWGALQIIPGYLRVIQAFHVQSCLNPLFFPCSDARFELHRVVLATSTCLQSTRPLPRDWPMECLCKPQQIILTGVNVAARSTSVSLVFGSCVTIPSKLSTKNLFGRKHVTRVHSMFECSMSFMNKCRSRCRTSWLQSLR